MSVEVDFDLVRTFITYALQSWQRGLPSSQRVAGEFSVVWNSQSSAEYQLSHFTIGEISRVSNEEPEVQHLFHVPVTLYVKPKTVLFVQILMREYQAVFFEDKRVLVHEVTDKSLT